VGNANQKFQIVSFSKVFFFTKIRRNGVMKDLPRWSPTAEIDRSFKEVNHINNLILLEISSSYHGNQLGKIFVAVKAVMSVYLEMV